VGGGLFLLSFLEVSFCSHIVVLIIYSFAYKHLLLAKKAIFKDKKNLKIFRRVSMSVSHVHVSNLWIKTFFLAFLFLVQHHAPRGFAHVEGIKIHCLQTFEILPIVFTNLLFTPGAHYGVGVSLQERIKGPTAASCADGKISGPSAQKEARGGGEEGRRHR
jgi:hypothetical protein